MTNSIYIDRTVGFSDIYNDLGGSPHVITLHGGQHVCGSRPATGEWTGCDCTHVKTKGG